MQRIAIDTADDPRVAHYRNLNLQNATRQSGRFIVEGEKLVGRLIASKYAVESLFVEPAYADLYEPLLPGETVAYVATRELVRATIGFNFHRGVLGCGLRQPSPKISELIPVGDGPATIIVCPDVHDPQNLGSILRTSAAFGASGVILGPRCADPFSRRVLRVSMGSVLTLPLVELADIAQHLMRLRDEFGFEIAATVLDPAAEPLAGAKRGARLALLLGGEAHGLERHWLELSTRQITIPMQLGTDSLNVAIAAAVFLYHFTR